MNNLKFRAWDKLDKVMRVVDCIDFENETVWSKGVGRHFDDCDLLTCIGSKDKNRKEIFKGDIVKTRFGIGIVEFISGAFVYDKTLRDFETTEVIGNIYQDKHLLK